MRTLGLTKVRGVKSRSSRIYQSPIFQTLSALKKNISHLFAWAQKMHLTPLFQSSVGQKSIKRWPWLCRADLWFPRIAGRRRGGCRPDLEDCRGGAVSSQLLQHKYTKIWIGNSAHFFRPPNHWKKKICGLLRNLWVYSMFSLIQLAKRSSFTWPIVFFAAWSLGCPTSCHQLAPPGQLLPETLRHDWITQKKWIVLYVTKSFTPRIMDDNVIPSYPHAKK